MIYRAEDIAKMLGVSTKAVYNMVYKGQLPARKLGRRVVFLERDLKAFFSTLPQNEVK